jgi:hypothetical protein
MEGKLRQLMKHEGINSTRLAEIMGIQASGVSHIMSGRNKPSFDFLLKLLQRFPQINPDWLLLDKGPMYRGDIKNKGGNTHGEGQQQGDGNQRGGGNNPLVGNTPSGGNSISGADPISGVAPGSESGYAPIGAAQAAQAEVSGRQGGFVSDIATPYIAGGVRNMGATGASRGLFEPDNADIIPSGASIGGYATQQLAQSPQQPMQSPQQLAQSPQQTMRPSEQQASQKAPQEIVHQAAQQSVYQHSGFTKSAMIERIVVFYKDKTFSEYQPG